MADISIIISTLKDRNEISAIEAIRADNSAEYELIISDKHGLAAARNQGIQKASTDKLVFLDDDSHPRSEYLGKVSELLDRHAIVAGRVVDPGNDYFARMTENYDYDQGNEPQITDSLVGCNFAVRRKVFDTVGMFNERFDWGHEDAVFADKAANEFDIYYCPDLIVEHRFCETATEFWRKQWKFGRSDVYRAQIQDESVFSNWYEAVPVSGDSTLEGIAVKSVGKSLRISRALIEIFGERVLRS